MNTEALQKVAEVVKTLNLNINSETGKETIIEITRQLKPILVWLYIIKPILISVLGLIVVIAITIIISKAVNKYYDRKGE